MAKLVWKFVMQPSLPLVQVLRQRYQRGNNLCEVRRLSGDFQVWRGVIEGMKVVQQGLQLHVGDGSSTRVWDDI